MNMKKEYYKDFSIKPVTYSIFPGYIYPHLTKNIISEDWLLGICVLLGINEESMMLQLNKNDSKNECITIDNVIRIISNNLGDILLFDKICMDDYNSISIKLVDILESGGCLIHTVYNEDSWLLVVGYHGVGDSDKDIITILDLNLNEVKTYRASEVLIMWESGEYISINYNNV